MLVQLKPIATCNFMDESCGSARALQGIWTSHGQNVYNINSNVINIIAHNLTTCSGFSSTDLQTQ